jgi:hypothetical protein
VDSGIEEPNKSKPISKQRLMSNESLPKIAANDKCFTEVSYDFLSDLSKLNEYLINKETNPAKSKLKHSKSFNKNQIVNTGVQFNQLNNTNAAFNPFCRSNISKSFSAFTSRFKQQASLRKKRSNHTEDHNPAVTKPFVSANSNVKRFNVNTCEKLNSSETVSRTSSPTLSSCSYSSSTTSSGLHAANHPHQQIVLSSQVETTNPDSSCMNKNGPDMIISL